MLNLGSDQESVVRYLTDLQQRVAEQQAEAARIVKHQKFLKVPEAVNDELGAAAEEVRAAGVTYVRLLRECVPAPDTGLCLTHAHSLGQALAGHWRCASHTMAFMSCSKGRSFLILHLVSASASCRWSCACCCGCPFANGRSCLASGAAVHSRSWMLQTWKRLWSASTSLCSAWIVAYPPMRCVKLPRLDLRCHWSCWQLPLGPAGTIRCRHQVLPCKLCQSLGLEF